MSERIANADHGGNAFSPDLQARMAGRMYEVVPLKVTVDEALKVVASKGVTEVANIVTSDSPEVPRSVQVALGVGLVEHFDAQGNYAEAQIMGGWGRSDVTKVYVPSSMRFSDVDAAAAAAGIPVEYY